ncbi:MAG: molybdopterin oxidoreductase, partial [Armatimonadetes bacterium]|nr:molybdopterin oxidoreductase [Armatimonadota bacterium]
MKQLLEEFPEAKWHQYEPANRDNVHEGAVLGFHQPADAIYSFDKADVVVSLDSDFLNSGPGHLRYARDFAAKRRVRLDKKTMNRFYAIESTLTVTGSMADHRLPLKASSVLGAASFLTASLGVGSDVQAVTEEERHFLTALAHDLEQHRGRSIVIAGDHQPPAVHALAHTLNSILENDGATVRYVEPVEANTDSQAKSIVELANAMDKGVVDVVLILGGNPAFTAPADLAFADKLRKVAFSAHLSLYRDETSTYCRWHLPMAHELEAWGDARAFDGTASITQPLIEPLYAGQSAIEVLAGVLGKRESGYDIVRRQWLGSGLADDVSWKRALHKGVIPNTARTPKNVGIMPGVFPSLSSVREPAAGIEINFRPDSTIWDGRFANNAWLQELPKPVQKY